MTSYLPQIDKNTSNTSILSPEEEKAKFEAFSVVLGGISDKVDDIVSRLDELTAKPKANRAKKEVDSE